MKLLASVESTTMLIDNQLCVREGGLAFAERDPPAGVLFSSPPSSRRPPPLLSYPMLDPMKIHTVRNRSHRCNYQSGSPQ